MQLVAYGAQDIYLTGNPQITFFKVVYRRHTNFSMECIEQTLNGNVAASQMTTATISRNGDLIHRMYYEVDAGTLDADDDNNYGTHLLDKVELEIGGQQIDKHSGHFMETYFQLTDANPNGNKYIPTADMVTGDPALPASTAADVPTVGDNTAITAAIAEAGSTFSTTLEASVAAGIETAIARVRAATARATKLQRMSSAGGVDSAAIAPGIIYVPLQFWFCRNPGLALPLIALQYHEVKVKLTFSAALNETAAKLWVDYIYLDTDERRRFAQQSHEYLIEQVQEQAGSANVSQELNFNHPVKELIWTGAYANNGAAPTSGTVQAHGNANTDTNLFTLKLNGHERFGARPMKYFTRVQVWEHHTGYGGVDANDSIAVYSFALKPEEHQPSGTCNFSRIDNALLQATSGTQTPCPATGKIFAINYNVLRIMSGMGGLAYSN